MKHLSKEVRKKTSSGSFKKEQAKTIGLSKPVAVKTDKWPVKRR